MEEYPLRYKEGGPLAEDDEVWLLVIPDQGDPYVEHERSWKNPCRETIDKASSHYLVGEFLEMGDEAAKATLKKVLLEAGISLCASSTVAKD